MNLADIIGGLVTGLAGFGIGGCVGALLAEREARSWPRYRTPGS